MEQNFACEFYVLIQRQTYYIQRTYAAYPDVYRHYMCMLTFLRCAGGQDKIRPLWRHYFQNTQGLIFVVDSVCGATICVYVYMYTCNCMNPGTCLDH